MAALEDELRHLKAEKEVLEHSAQDREAELQIERQQVKVCVRKCHSHKWKACTLLSDRKKRTDDASLFQERSLCPATPVFCSKVWCVCVFDCPLPVLFQTLQMELTRAQEVALALDDRRQEDTDSARQLLDTVHRCGALRACSRTRILWRHGRCLVSSVLHILITFRLEGSHSPENLGKLQDALRNGGFSKKRKAQGCGSQNVNLN